MRHQWIEKQFGCRNLIPDLKRLSKAKASDLDENKEPLLAFKDKYSILHDKLQAKYGLMCSNSRLAEQMHGSLRSGLLSEYIGMAQADARQSHKITTTIVCERRGGMVVPMVNLHYRSINKNRNTTTKLRGRL